MIEPKGTQHCDSCLAMKSNSLALCFNNSFDLHPDFLMVKHLITCF